MVKKTKAVVLHTREPVNVASLTDIASRRASRRVCWPGWDVSIRTVIQAYLSRVDNGFLPVTWHEWGGTEDVGFKTRRYSGEGPGVVGRSLFCLPRALRGCGRHGLWNTVDIDQDNSHFHAQLTRHLGRHCLLRYIRERGTLRKMVVDATGVAVGDAKQLFCWFAIGVWRWC